MDDTVLHDDAVKYREWHKQNIKTLTVKPKYTHLETLFSNVLSSTAYEYQLYTVYVVLNWIGLVSPGNTKIFPLYAESMSVQHNENKSVQKMLSKCGKMPRRKWNIPLSFTLSAPRTLKSPGTEDQECTSASSAKTPSPAQSSLSHENMPMIDIRNIDTSQMSTDEIMRLLTEPRTSTSSATGAGSERVREPTTSEYPRQDMLDASNGCIVAEDMGMGKTLITHMISYAFSGVSIIAVPSTMIDHWCSQARSHFRNQQTEYPVLRYTGVVSANNGSDMVIKFLSSVPISTPCAVVVSHAMLRAHFTAVFDNPTLHTLSGKPWLLCVDEGDVVRNPDTILSKYIAHSKFRGRVIVTASPFHNDNNGEWISYAKMIGIVASNYVLPHDRAHASAALRSIQHNLLKRMIRMSLTDVDIVLPPCTHTYRLVTMSIQEKLVYMCLVARIESILSRSAAKRTVNVNDQIQQQNIPTVPESTKFIAEFIHLRHAAIDTHMLPLHLFLSRTVSDDEDYDDSDGSEEVKKPVMRLGDILQTESQFQLPFSIPTFSTVLREIAQLCREIKNRDGKVLVMCEWRIPLHNLKPLLREMNVSFVMMDGTIEPDARAKIIAKFRRDLTITAFLMTIKTGGYGICLPEANNVILAHPTFNPEIERHAIKRVHRPGQTRPVNVYTFITLDTYSVFTHFLAARKAKRNDQHTGMSSTDFETPQELRDMYPDIDESNTHSFRESSDARLLNDVIDSYVTSDLQTKIQAALKYVPKI